MFKFNFSKGYLGLNARNLLYIKEYNKIETIKFADSKLKTKHYLSARSIPVPKLYNVIKSHEEIAKIDLGSIPGSFVVKPNKGSGGDGIIAFKEKSSEGFITVNNKLVTFNEFKTHLADIIDGAYSMNNINDIALLEQRIITHKSLMPYTFEGLPDIRVIVYNMIPVMAMLRLPTKESQGKANLAQGAVGVGIDLSTGKPTYIARKFKIIPEIPGVGKFDKDFKIPYFDEILHISSKCQQISNLGYLACDIALDDNSGPILLELNARAGLKVQIANKAPLRKRLEQIKDIKVKTPEKGVRVAKDMFGSKDTQLANKKLINKNILGFEEYIDLILDNTNLTKLTAKIDPMSDESIISSRLAKSLNIDSKTIKSKIKIGGEKITTVLKIKNIKNGHDIILSTKILQNFLIDPSKKLVAEAKKTLPSPSKTSTKPFSFYKPTIDYGKVDFSIYEISSKIKFISRLAPANLATETEKFKNTKNYNPKFEYKINTEQIIELQQALNEIQTDSTNLGIIFDKKIQELKAQLNILQAIGTDSYTDATIKLFKKPTEEEYQIALKLLNNRKLYKNLNTKPVSAKEAASQFNDALKKYNLSNWQIEYKQNMIASCSVSKENKIFLNPKATFEQYRVEKLIAHEIETHILTAENGKRQPYRIFQNGTANFLETQEGLAIYNQELALHIYPHSYFASINLISAKICAEYGFSDAVQKIIELGIDQEKAESLVLRCKRGMGDTSKPGGIYKEAIYFRGAIKIDQYVKSGGKLNNLYIGKIAIEDLELYESIKSLNKPKFIPIWY